MESSSVNSHQIELLSDDWQPVVMLKPIDSNSEHHSMSSDLNISTELGARVKRSTANSLDANESHSSNSSLRSSPVAVKREQQANGEDNDGNNDVENFSLYFRQNIPKIAKLRPMKKGDLVANCDCSLLEAHKNPLFTVDVAPYVLPPLGIIEKEMGTQEERQQLRNALQQEEKRVADLKRCAKSRSKFYASKFDPYPDADEHKSKSDDDARRRLEKGLKQREILGQYPQYLVATSGGRHVCIYVTTEAANSKMILRNVYEDTEGDEFYSIKFTVIRKRKIKTPDDDTDIKVLVCSGLKGHFRVIDVSNGKLLFSIESAAGQGINEIAVHPKYPEIVACVSKDLSVRVWNIATCNLVLVLHSNALYGHVSELLTCDWSPDDGNKLISSGMDHYLVLWDLSHKKYKEAIDFSYIYKENQSSSTKRTTGNHYKNPLPLFVHFPELVNKTIHKNYIDSVKFLTSNIIISKSSENYIAAWTNESRIKEDNTVKSLCSILFQYELTNSKIWFMKMALQPTSRRLLALGLQDGRVMVLDLKSDSDPSRLRVNFLRTGSNVATGAIRHVAFSPDSRILIVVTQDAKVIKYSLNGSAVVNGGGQVSFAKCPDVVEDIHIDDFLGQLLPIDRDNLVAAVKAVRLRSDPGVIPEETYKENEMENKENNCNTVKEQMIENVEGNVMEQNSIETRVVSEDVSCVLQETVADSEMEANC